jgi:phosphoribosylformimino-5-aminoimidazole carboxamide ribotide isomerase
MENNKIEVIPTMDIIDGRCVRLSMGDYSKKREYSNNPLDQAKRFEDIGFKKLHFIDLDGAKSLEPCNLEVVEKIAQNTKLSIQFGGGVKSEESAERVFSAGVKKIIIGSLAVTNPSSVLKIINSYGIERVILGLDLLDGRIAVNGWLDIVDNNVKPLLKYYISKGISSVICTDISKDGMLMGPSFNLYASLSMEFPDVDIVASGGIRSVSDLELLKCCGIREAIVGKALYEGDITNNEIVRWLRKE